MSYVLACIFRVCHCTYSKIIVSLWLLRQNERGAVHGNIRCRNVLVFRHERTTFMVKLADVGLVHYYNSLPLDSAVNQERYNSLHDVLSTQTLPSFNMFKTFYVFFSHFWTLFLWHFDIPGDSFHSNPHYTVLARPLAIMAIILHYLAEFRSFRAQLHKSGWLAINRFSPEKCYKVHQLSMTDTLCSSQ